MTIREEAYQILNEVYGKNLRNTYHKQLDCIEATLSNHRTLVVQKTGWGKSAIYFTCTKINRLNHKGVTLVISPLLVLIENQILAANRFGLKAEKFDGTNHLDHSMIINKLITDQIDILFITPESLIKNLVPHLKNIKLGMFVIDEVHCISEWGHDFRMDYRKLVDVVHQLNYSSFPILATTATATSAVIEDLKEQIGPNLKVYRGNLFRDNLYIQPIMFDSKETKYAWILQHINDFLGVGIIYCLTTRECDDLSNFLVNYGIAARPYHNNLDDEAARKNIELFEKNEVKVICATNKLGMGYDKGDIKFIIHFQKPKSLVSYYQEMGRAGRNISHAISIVMSSPDDENVLNYFIDNAFPTEGTMREVLNAFDKINDRAIEKARNKPFSLFVKKPEIRIGKIVKEINKSKPEIENAIKFLEFNGYVKKSEIKKDSGKIIYAYAKMPKQFVYDGNHYRKITQLRKQQAIDVAELFKTDECINSFMLKKLGEEEIGICKFCANCLDKIISEDIDPSYLEEVKKYEKMTYYPIQIIRCYRACYSYSLVNGAKEKLLEGEFIPGFALCRYRKDYLGKIAFEMRESNETCSAEIIEKAIKLFKKENYIKKHNFEYITCVPSYRNKNLNSFTKKIGELLNLKYVDCIEKINSQIEQKTMHNQHFQIKNVKENYKLNDKINYKDMNIVLVDDVIRSGATISNIGYKLLKAGAKKILPLVIADASITKNFEDEDDEE
ncbi:MAG: RecQ family ATP-dependent DNA helicase [Bacilli bacterium]|nr:RecQ family ATP-dependent DNA helicase [Bacilli bacterium]